jgi:hypothetical protein
VSCDSRAEAGCTFKQGLGFHHGEECERSPECPRWIEAQNQVPQAEGGLGGKCGDKEAEKPVGGNEWHRECQRAKMSSQGWQMKLDELFGHVSVDGVPDHRLDVVIGQHLLDNVREQPEGTLLILDEQKQRSSHKVHALAIGHLRVAASIRKQYATHFVDEVGCEPWVVGKGAAHVEMDGFQHRCGRRAGCARQVGGRPSLRDQVMVKLGLRIHPLLSAAQQHPSFRAVLRWDAGAACCDKARGERSSSTVLLPARLLKQLGPIEGVESGSLARL